MPLHKPMLEAFTLELVNLFYNMQNYQIVFLEKNETSNLLNYLIEIK